MRSQPAFSRHQAGTALLTAILVAAIATIIAATLADDYQLQFRRTAVMARSEAAIQYALGAESWAREILAEDARTGALQENEGAEPTPIDHRLEAWATPLPPLPIEGGTVEGTLEDLHGRFNLNNLLLDSGKEEEQWVYVPQFRRLLENLGVERNAADAMARKTLDWIDGDRDETYPEGAEDDLYTGREPPYRTANHVITNPTELLAIADMDVAIWRTVSPFVTALPLGSPAGGAPGTPGAPGGAPPGQAVPGAPGAPGQPGAAPGQEGTRINPNTALPVVIESVYEVGTGAGAQIYQRVSEEPFVQFDAPANQELRMDDQARPQAQLNPNPYTLQSRFFRLEVRVALDGTLVTMYSLLERSGETVWTRFRTFNTE